MACGCFALGAAVVIPVVVWIVRDLNTAANVAEVVSIPLTAVSLLLGLVAAWSGGDQAAEDDSGGDQQPSPFWNGVRRWATLLPIRRRWAAANSRRRVLRITVIVVVGGLLTAGGFFVRDQVLGNRPGADLLARVPEPLRGHCVQDDPVGIGASATLNCQDASGQEVVISLFGTELTMDEAYGEILRQTGIPRGSGDCAITTGAEHRYSGTGAPTGRALCYRQDGNAFLVWTNDEERTVAGARRRDGNDVELYRFWASLIGVPSFPTPDERELIDLAQEAGCRRAPAGSLDRFPGVVAAVECEAGDPGANTVSFYRFADPDALRRSYSSQVRDVHAKTAACVDGEAPGFLGEESWNIRGVDLGRILCYPGQQDELVMEWTVESMSLLVRGVGADPAALSEWWKEDAGPTSEAIIGAFNAQLDPPFPKPVEQELLDHIPGPSRVECTRISDERVSEDVSGDPVAAIVCGTRNDGPQQVRYYQFPDSASTTASYDEEASPGPDCNSQPPDFTGQAEYSRNGTVTGRLACATNNAGFPYLVWTHDRLNILALAFKDEDPAPLLAWWQAEAGPV